jgi:aspartyl/asparaginyl beta-hydroxylase (cupin superfamily)
MKLYAHQLEPEHIYLGMQKLALEAKQDRDKLRALELMAKIRGMFVERSQSEVNVTFNNAVPRPIITVPQEHIPTTEVKEQQEGEGI